MFENTMFPIQLPAALPIDIINVIVNKYGPNKRPVCPVLRWR